jgi:hypothetical protein
MKNWPPSADPALQRSARAASVAVEKDEPCDDYWSAAAAINRMYAEMHGYHFYLWGDAHNAVSGPPLASSPRPCCMQSNDRAGTLASPKPFFSEP